MFFLPLKSSKCCYFFSLKEPEDYKVGYKNGCMKPTKQNCSLNACIVIVSTTWGFFMSLISQSKHTDPLSEQNPVMTVMLYSQLLNTKLKNWDISQNIFCFTKASHIGYGRVNVDNWTIPLSFYCVKKSLNFKWWWMMILMTNLP